MERKVKAEIRRLGARKKTIASALESEHGVQSHVPSWAQPPPSTEQIAVSQEIAVSSGQTGKRGKSFAFEHTFDSALVGVSAVHVREAHIPVSSSNVGDSFRNNTFTCEFTHNWMVVNITDALPKSGVWSALQLIVESRNNIPFQNWLEKTSAHDHPLLVSRKISARLHKNHDVVCAFASSAVPAQFLEGSTITLSLIIEDGEVSDLMVVVHVTSTHIRLRHQRGTNFSRAVAAMAQLPNSTGTLRILNDGAVHVICDGHVRNFVGFQETSTRATSQTIRRTSDVYQSSQSAGNSTVTAISDHDLLVVFVSTHNEILFEGGWLHDKNHNRIASILHQACGIIICRPLQMLGGGFPMSVDLYAKSGTVVSQTKPARYPVLGIACRASEIPGTFMMEEGGCSCVVVEKIHNTTVLFPYNYLLQIAGDPPSAFKLGADENEINFSANGNVMWNVQRAGAEMTLTDTPNTPHAVLTCAITYTFKLPPAAYTPLMYVSCVRRIIRGLAASTDTSGDENIFEMMCGVGGEVFSQLTTTQLCSLMRIMVVVPGSGTFLGLADDGSIIINAGAGEIAHPNASRPPPTYHDSRIIQVRVMWDDQVGKTLPAQRHLIDPQIIAVVVAPDNMEGPAPMHVHVRDDVRMRELQPRNTMCSVRKLRVWLTYVRSGDGEVVELTRQDHRPLVLLLSVHQQVDPCNGW